MNRTLPGLFVVLLLSACAAPGGSPGASASPGLPDPDDGGAIEHPAGDAAVLVVDWAGGFVPVEFNLTRLPAFVMLGDGRVIVQGAQTLEFPGPALPPLVVRTLTPQGVQLVLAAVEETNLFTSDLELRGAMNFVADAADTIFTLEADGRQVSVSVYGLGAVPPDMESAPGMTQSEIQAHDVLGRLNERLMMLDGWLPAEAWEAEGWRPYEPDAFRLYVRDVTGQPVEGGDLPEQVRAWPTDEDPAAFGEEQPNLGDGTRCGVVAGEAAELWLGELSAATQLTRWSDGGDRRFGISARPLLPHEEGICPDLAGA